MKISDILRHKGTDVATIGADGAVTDLLDVLASHGIGALVVTGSSGIAGIVSERDIVRALADRGASVLTAQVAGTMTERRIRHMPVLDNGALVGIVSIGDVVSSRIRQLEHDRVQLEHYITG